MKEIIVLITCAFLIGVKCDCTNEFDAIEEECAKLHGLNPMNVFYFFTRGYANVDGGKVDNFVKCTWQKWKFQDTKGNIDYNKIKQDKNIVWKFARFCADLVYNITTYENAFQSAITECQLNTTLATPESVRLCITGNYEKYVREY